MKKRIGSWLLTFAMVLALLPAEVMPAKAADITVTFDSNGGTAVTSQTIPSGGKAEEPKPAPTRTGYKFDGWYTGTGFSDGNRWNFDTAGLNNSFVLHAHWTIITYTVTFKDDNGVLGTQKVDYGQTAKEPDDLKKDGYALEGWYTNQTLTTSYNFSTQITEDITLYAKWDELYTVSFDAGGGTGTMAAVKTLGSYTLPACTFTAPAGKEFSKWEIGGTQYDEGATVTISSNTEVKAIWGDKTFKVSFDLQGHGSAVADQRVTNGGTATEPADPAETGYTFGGWYKEAACTNKWNFTDDMVTDDTTLYAKWTINSYTVTFDSKGGSSVDNQTIVYGGKAAKPANPTKTGADFIDWYKDAAFTALWNFDRDTVTGNTTIYARWRYTVTFDSKSGSSVDEQKIADGDKIAKPDDPTRTGYGFAGWYREDSLVHAWSFDTDTVADNLTLYAKWDKGEYTVTFMDGKSTVGSEKVKFDETVSAPTVTAKAKHEFKGWYSDAGLTQSFDFNTKIQSNLILYAKWEQNAFTVTFDANGGSGGMAEQTVPKDKPTALNRNTFTRTLYAFAEWNTKADGSGEKYADGADITLTDRDVTLYAQWDSDVYTVYFNSNGGTGRMEQQTVTKNTATPLKANAFTRAGYGFDGWSTNAGGTGTRYEDQAPVTLANDNLTLYAQWNANKYTITFDANGGEGTMTPQSGTKQKYTDKVTLKANAFTRDRYDFTGWSTTASGSAKYKDGASFTPEGDVKLYAQWAKKTYTVTFNSNGGSEVVSQTVDIYGRASKPDAPSKTGFVFDGWYTEAALTNEWDFDDLIDADITLYAKWTNRDLVVTFDANGGYGKMEEQKFKPGKATALNPNEFSRADRTFKGWNTKSDGSGTDYADEQSITPAEDLTLYAMWDPSVTFHANDGTDGKLVQLVAISGTTPLNANSFTRQGYVFKGWNTKADGTGTSYSDKQNVKLSGNTDLYAVWTPYTYTVRFNANGGTGVMAPQKFNYGVEQALTANAFTRTGRTFQGWSRTVGGEVEFSDKESVKDLTGENGKTIMLYAVWNVSAAPGGSIWIQKGNTVFESTTPKNGDPYAFRVDTGVYNVVVTSGNKMVTMMVKSDGGTLKGASVIQPETVSSVLDVKENTPDIVVGNLDVAADSNRVRGAEAELRLTVESKSETASDADQQAIRKASPSGRSLDFLDLTLTKTVNGKEDTTFRQETKENLIIVVPFKKAATKDITVYRCHNGTVDALTADAQKDEYIEVTDDTVTIYAKKFSTYAICYTPLEAETTYSSCPRNHTCPIMPFDDSNPMSWYHDGVHWALDNGAMQGVSPRRFLPNGTTDRAQFVTILWRLEGSPRASGSTAFNDVPADAWYAEAVRWAAANGIVTGVSPHYFNPGGTLTREQLATMLHRYVRLKNAAAAGAEATGLSGFRDASAISDWARDAMAWMATYGIFDGTTNSAGDRFLTPQGNATRAQTATVMMRCWDEYIG